MKCWHALEVRVPPSLRDLALALLAEAPITGIEEDVEDPGRLTAYAARPWDVVGWTERIRALAGSDAPAAVRGYEVAEEDWLRRWKEGWSPTPLGESLVAVPAWWEGPLPGDRRPVRIDPGTAFGTGTHATTALAWELLEPCLPGARWLLDVGTGTGILALGALTLVPGLLAVGTEADPLAVVSARANREANPETAARLHLVLAREVPVHPSGFDLVAANLTEAEAAAVREELCRALAPGGRLVLGGYLEEQARASEPGWRELGLSLEERRVRDGWAAMRWRRGSGGGEGGR